MRSRARPGPAAGAPAPPGACLTPDTEIEAIAATLLTFQASRKNHTENLTVKYLRSNGREMLAAISISNSPLNTLSGIWGAEEVLQEILELIPRYSTS